jgi:hypothetical protein
MILRRLKANDYKMPTHALPVKICRVFQESRLVDCCSAILQLSNCRIHLQAEKML